MSEHSKLVDAVDNLTAVLSRLEDRLVSLLVPTSPTVSGDATLPAGEAQEAPNTPEGAPKKRRGRKPKGSEAQEATNEADSSPVAETSPPTPTQDTPEEQTPQEQASSPEEPPVKPSPEADPVAEGAAGPSLGDVRAKAKRVLLLGQGWSVPDFRAWLQKLTGHTGLESCTAQQLTQVHLAIDAAAVQ